MLNTGVKAWEFGYTQYVQAAVKNVKEYLENNGQLLKAKALDPFTKGYRPEIDISEELGPKESSYYKYLIGIVRWMVELGRVDICTEVSMILSHLAMPRKGHL